MGELSQTSQATPGSDWHYQMRQDRIRNGAITMGQWNKAGGENPVRTAVRFPMQLSVTLETDAGPVEAETVNVSSAGLLFVTPVLPPVGSKIVFQMAMPSAVTGGETDVAVHCVGRIVRHETVGGTRQAAAVIDEYTLKV